MNLTYRLIWDAVTHGYVPAITFVRNGKIEFRIVHIAYLSALPLFSPAAFSAPAPTELPSGGQVTTGQASINANGAHMDVNQTSQNAGIDWQTFNIGQNAQVDFHQPNTSAVAVNRIADPNGSQVMGRLNANGQIYLINPNGVLFGRGSQVNVGGLVASTLDTGNNSADDRRTFASAGGNGKIVNQGTLNSDGGYIALLGQQVSNQGVIQARLGTVALAAGDKITLEFAGDKLVNVEVDKGALQALAENKQLIQADGGTVLMTAKAADALLSTVVNNEGVIEARSVENHNGVIKLLGDMDSGTVNVGGTLDASAPPPSPSGRGAGGERNNGGFIETSAAHVKVADGAVVTTKAENGRSGTWLIDPVDFTIATGSGALTTSGIGATTLSTSLGLGNVSIATDASTGGNGDIFVNSAVSWSANTLLKLIAHGNIYIDANLSGSGATGQLYLAYGQQTATGNNYNYFLRNGAKVNLAAGANFTTEQGYGADNTILGDGGGTMTNYTVITSLGAAGSVTTTDLQGMGGNLAGKYALGADIDASGTSSWNGNAGFTSVGTSATKFTGKFDGLGHTISNLSIDHAGAESIGLFGNTNDAVLQNVGLLNVNIYGNTGGTGALAGRIEGGSSVTRNSYADGGSVKARSHYVGGLVGLQIGTGSISYSYANVRVESSDGGSATDAFAGGLVGGNNGGSIDHSYATGSVTGKAGDPTHNLGIGGLVGLQTGTGSISTSYATGAVSAVAVDGSSTLGGLIGQPNGGGGSVTSSYWDKTTTGQPSTANVTGGSGNDGTGLTTAEWPTNGPFSASPSGGAWSAADWGAGNPYPGVKALPYITITASASQTYGSAAAFGIASILDQNGTDASGLVNTGSLVWQAETTAASPAGTTSAVRGSGATRTGYQILYAGNLTVAAAPVVYVYVPPSVTGSLTGTVSKIYDGTTAALLTPENFLLSGFIGNDSATVTKTVGTYASPNAGSGILVTANLTSSDYAAVGTTHLGNYSLPTSLSGAIGVIDKAPLSVTANAAGKIYDGLAYTGGNGASFNGFVNGETAAVLDGTLVYGGSSQGAIDAGNYAITPAGLTASNYALNFTDGALTVSPVSVVFVQTSVTGSLTGTVSKVYDGTTTALLTPANFLLSGFVGNDAATLIKTGGTYASPNAGSGILVTANLAPSDYAAVGATKLGNYTLPSSVSGAIGVIDKAPLAVTANAAAKTYDGLAYKGGNGASFNGFVNGETATVLDGTLAYGGSSQGAIDAGKYVIAPSGLTSPNYALNFTDGTLTVTPAPVVFVQTSVTGSLTGTTGKVYDGTTTARLTPANFLLSGFAGNESATVTKTSGTYASPNVGNAILVTANLAPSDYAPLGKTKLANYLLPDSVSGAIGVIDKAPLTITANNAAKTYDGLAYKGDNGVTYKGFIASEDPNILDGTLAYGGSSQGVVNAGSYAIVPSGLTASNYDIRFAGGNLAVNPAPLTITALDADKVYDGLAYRGGNGVIYKGFVGGESPDVLSGTLVYGGNSQGAINGGSYAIVPSGLTSSNYAMTFADGHLTVKPAPLTVTALADGKTYNGLAYNGGNGVAYSGFIGSEQTGVLDGTLAYGGSSQGAVNTGSYAIMPSGLTSPNYAITYVMAELAVTPATLTYTATPAGFFNGQTPSGLSGTVDGFAAGDTLENSTTGSLAWTTPAGTSSQPGQFPISGGGLTLTNNNYIFVQAPDNAISLTLKPGRPQGPVLNTMALMESNILSPQSATANPSTTITVAQGSGADTGNPSSLESGNGVPNSMLNTTMNIGGAGSTLTIMNLGVNLPGNALSEDENE